MFNNLRWFVYLFLIHSSEHRFYRLLIGMIIILNNMNINRNVKIIIDINTNRKTKTNVTINKNTKNNICDHVSLFFHINIVNYLYFFYLFFIQLLYFQQSLLRFIVYPFNNLLSFIVFLFNNLLFFIVFLFNNCLTWISRLSEAIKYRHLKYLIIEKKFEVIEKEIENIIFGEK